MNFISATPLSGAIHWNKWNKKFLIKNDPLPLETLNEISDIVYGCLKRNSDNRMTIEQILDSEYLKDAKQKNTIKTILLQKYPWWYIR